ncbi:hypothetical protein BV898_10626 [Hypsibius exemplaris]|uniref:Uncharacterized protein n=1 Tax=Hypsibius exemplaris TaxID=2072580 RepID=A0A1W0WJ57_HYPEX|nr:hypothetical protein BV898_10626 [Hypsibius exemplaris]
MKELHLLLLILGLEIICVTCQSLSWEETGGEQPVNPSDKLCPVLGTIPGQQPDTSTSSPASKRYTKCYKTRPKDSECFNAQDKDCFDELRANLLTVGKYEIVCCPGPCAWIFEHAWINGQNQADSGSLNQYFQSVYDKGGQVPGLSAPNIEASGLFPTLRAGCAVEAPILPAQAVNPPVPAITNRPRTCPVLGSRRDQSSPPVCVQRLYAKTVLASPPAVLTPSDLWPVTTCTMHCCEGDLCNGVTNVRVVRRGRGELEIRDVGAGAALAGKKPVVPETFDVVPGMFNQSGHESQPRGSGKMPDREKLIRYGAVFGTSDQLANQVLPLADYIYQL